MSVLVGRETRVVVQGMGQTRDVPRPACREYGTPIVAGVTPGKGGTTVEGFPLFDSVGEAVRATGANASLIFVPPAGAADAILEAADDGLGVIVCITEGIPTARHGAGQRLPDGPAGDAPDRPELPGPHLARRSCKIGIMPGHIHAPGLDRCRQPQRDVDLRGRGPAHRAGAGAVDLHRDRRRSRSSGRRTATRWSCSTTDAETEAIVLIGEIGGTRGRGGRGLRPRPACASPWSPSSRARRRPLGARMGHAGAIIAGGKGTAREKMDALRSAGISVVASPAEIGVEVARRLGRA